MEGRFLFAALYMMMIYICTKFHENILNGNRVTERTQKLTDGQTDGRTDRRTEGTTYYDPSPTGVKKEK